MALAYCIGLVQAVLLLGHGLVAVPRRMIVHADPRRSLTSLQLRAPGVHDNLVTATEELLGLQLLLKQLQRQKNGLSQEYQEWIDDLALNVQTVQPSGSSIPRQAPSAPGVITDRYLAELGRRIIRTRHKHIRFTQTWRYLVDEAVETQAVIDARASHRLEPLSRSRGILGIPALTPYGRYVLHARMAPPLRIGFGGFLAVASVFVIWSEFIKNVASKLSLVSLTVAPNDSVAFAGQLMSAFWILYMCACVLSSFDDVKVWGNRALVRRHTYPESACWYAGQVAKMTVPLTYNFLTFLPRDLHRITVFFDFLGQLIILTPLGKGFDYFFPMLILLPAAATLFNLYGRVKTFFGLGIIEDPSFEGGSWVEGRDLIARELQGRSRLDSGTPLENDAPSSDRARYQSPTSGTLGRNDGNPPRPARTSRSVEVEAEEDEGAFSSFAHRVQNTVDAWERPKWLQDLGKRPRWMGGDDGPSSTGQGFGGLGGIFRSGSGQGRIQL